MLSGVVFYLQKIHEYVLSYLPIAYTYKAERRRGVVYGIQNWQIGSCLHGRIQEGRCLP
jgi:hypothetical protein